MSPTRWLRAYAAGTASGNAFQYIGRENDPTGLYYMHARYYSPAVGRFISEDPLGFAGADVNLHAYTFGSPTNLRDPNGTNPLVAACAFGAATDVGLNLFADYYTGRKTRWQDAFSSATLRYAGEGCVSGLEGAMFSELVLAPIIDMAAPLVAKVFTSEAAAAIDDGVSAACDMCFPAGTPVWTRNGKVPIEKIKVGDEVLSRNMQTGKLEYKKVISLVRPHQDRLMELHIAGEPTPLRPTPSHPFFVKHAGKGGASWIKASELTIGDLIFTRKGKWAEITTISPIKDQQTVYNFEVGNDHDYFVGGNAVLVHNGTCRFGNEVHQNFQQVLVDQTGTAPEDWLMRTNPGQNGVDATYIGDPANNPGFSYAELKPVGYPDTAVGNQVSRWALPEGKTSIWWYNNNGIIGQTLGIW